MASALLAATGLIAWQRLRGREPGVWTWLPVALLLTYATLVRANAVFATVPLAVGLVAPWQWRHWPRRVAAIAAITLAVLAVSPAINHRLLGAHPMGVEFTQPIYDMAGIARHGGADAVPILPPEQWRRAHAERCTSPILWDNLASDQRCGYVQQGVQRHPRRAIFSAWIATAATHPLAYATHRIAHWNSTMRWFVPWHYPLAMPMAESEPNLLGLRSAGPAALVFDGVAGWLADSPLGAPILAFAVALAVLGLARSDAGPAHGLAIPLALSAVAMEASFLVVSISSDWRYHLWSMVAAYVAAILLLTRRVSRRPAQIALACVLLVAGSSLVARLTLSPVGDDYYDALR
jgi:hypothetical protein